jgi:NAD(P)-dependent dehydrogenase (short-subunit alcohol dehydrogenase family)
MASQKERSRIIAVSSSGHFNQKIFSTDLHFKNGREYTPLQSYGQSKLANILFAKKLADELKNTKVRIVSLHPGVIATNLLRHMTPYFRFIVKRFFVNKSISQGASTTLYGCLCPEFDKKELSGSFFSFLFYSIICTKRKTISFTTIIV